MLPFFTTNPATVLTPSGKTHYPKIEDNKDGTVTIRYQPTESGLHELDVRYNKEPIQGTMDDLRYFNCVKSKRKFKMFENVFKLWSGGALFLKNYSFDILRLIVSNVSVSIHKI